MAESEFFLEVVEEVVELLETAEKGDPGTGSGDMLKSVYDPTAAEGDAFDMDEMAEGADAKILTAAERTKLAGVEDGAQVNRALASQVEAEAGTDNVKGMTALRTWQAIVKWASTATSIFSGLLKDYGETVNSANISGTHTMTTSTGNVQELTLTADTIITAPAVPTVDAKSLVVHIDGAFVVSWAASPVIVWQAGAPPTFNTVAGKINVITLIPNIKRGVWIGIHVLSEP